MLTRSPSFGEEEGSNIDQSGEMNDNWAAVSDVDDDRNSETEEAIIGGGVLIVPPAAEEEEEDADQEPTVDRVVESALNLSFPNTEASIPSDLGDMQSLDELRNVFVNSLLDSSVATRREDGTELSPFRNRRVLALLVLAAVAGFSLFGSTAYLLYERKSFQAENLRLRQELGRLELQVKKQGKRGVKKDPGSFSWEKGSCGDKSNEESTVIMDNCWLKAKGNIQFGNCADETKKSVQKHFKKLKKGLKKAWKQVDNLKDDLWEYSSSAFEGMNFPSATAEASSNSSSSDKSSGRFTAVRDMASIVTSAVAVPIVIGTVFLAGSLSEMSLFDGDNEKDDNRSTPFF